MKSFIGFLQGRSVDTVPMIGYQYIKESPGIDPKNTIEGTHKKDVIERSFIVCNMGTNMHYVYPNPQAFKSVLANMPVEARQFEEVIYGHLPQRFKMDIDADEKKVAFLRTHLPPGVNVMAEVLVTILDCIIEEFNRTYFSHFDDPDMTKLEYDDFILATASGTEQSKDNPSATVIKESYHIIFAPERFVFNSHLDCNIFNRMVVENLPDFIRDSGIIDMNVNKSLQKFRLAGCHKPRSNRIKRVIKDIAEFIGNKPADKENNEITDFFNDNLINSLWELTLIRVYDTSKVYMLPNLESDGSVGVSKKNVTKDEYVYDAAISIAAPYTKHFDVRKTQGNLILYNRIAASNCQFCKRVHDSDNTLYVFIDDIGQVYLGCWRMPNDRIVIGQIGNFGLQKTDSAKKGFVATKTVVNGLQSIQQQSNSDNERKVVGNLGFLQAVNAQGSVDNQDSNTYADSEAGDLPKRKKHIEYAYDKVISGKIQDTEITWKDYQPSNRYSEPQMQTYELAKSLIIHANMGLGKTKELVKFIDKYFNNIGVRILIISFRQTFTSSLVRGPLKEFGFKVYNEIKGSKIINEPKLIVQVESLHRVNLAEPYDLVILDEIESIFSQFGSGLFKNQLARVLGKFENIMKYSHHIVAMDANISDRTYNLMKYFRPDHEMFYHRNSFKNGVKDTWYFTDDKGVWFNEIRKALQAGERVFIPTNSLETANTVHKSLSAMFSKKECVIYTSRTNKDLRKLHFSDVNEYWSTADYLIITPTCTAGVSFEKTHYHKVFPFFTNQSCDVETCRQMVARVRIVSCNEYYVYVKSNYNCLPTKPDQIRRYICSTQRILETSVDTSGLESLFDFHYDQFDRGYVKDNIALKLYLENKRIENHSKNNFAARFMYQIAETGATIKLMENTDPDASLELALNLERTKKEINEEECRHVAEADELTDVEASDMTEAKNLARDTGGECELTLAEELALHKYYLRRFYSYHVPMTTKFVHTYDNQKTRDIYNNLKQVRNFTECTDERAFFRTLERIRLSEINKNNFTLDEAGAQMNVHSGRTFTKHRFCFALILSAGFKSVDDFIPAGQLFNNIRRHEIHIRQNADFINMTFGVKAILPVISDSGFDEAILEIINKILDIQYDIKIKPADQKISVLPVYRITRSTLFNFGRPALEDIKTKSTIKPNIEWPTSLIIGNLCREPTVPYDPPSNPVGEPKIQSIGNETINNNLMNLNTESQIKTEEELLSKCPFNDINSLYNMKLNKSAIDDFKKLLQ